MPPSLKVALHYPTHADVFDPNYDDGIVPVAFHSFLSLNQRQVAAFSPKEMLLGAITDVRVLSKETDRLDELEECYEALEEELLGDDGQQVVTLASLLTLCAAEGDHGLAECTGPSMLLATLHGLGSKLAKCLFERSVAAGGPMNYPAPPRRAPHHLQEAHSANRDEVHAAGDVGESATVREPGFTMTSSTPECRAAISALEAHLELTTSPEILVMVKAGIDKHLQGVHGIGDWKEISQSKSSGRLSKFLQYTANMLLGTGDCSGSGDGGDGGSAPTSVVVFTFMDKIVQQLYLGIERSSTPDDADSGVREFMASCVVSLVQDAIIGLSDEARQLSELTYIFLVRVFSEERTGRAAAALRKELPECFASDVMSLRRKVKLALLRKVEGRNDGNPSSGGSRNDGSAGAGASCSSSSGGGSGGGSCRDEIECANHFFRVTGSSWNERRVAELRRLQPSLVRHMAELDPSRKLSRTETLPYLLSDRYITVLSSIEGGRR